MRGHAHGLLARAMWGRPATGQVDAHARRLGSPARDAPRQTRVIRAKRGGRLESAERPARPGRGKPGRLVSPRRRFSQG